MCERRYEKKRDRNGTLITPGVYVRDLSEDSKPWYLVYERWGRLVIKRNGKDILVGKIKSRFLEILWKCMS